MKDKRERRRAIHEARDKRLKSVAGRDRLPEGFEGTLERSCYSKRRYRTEDQARATAEQCEADRGTKLRAYRCPLCDGWHLTKLNP